MSSDRRYSERLQFGAEDSTPRTCNLCQKTKRSDAFHVWNAAKDGSGRKYRCGPCDRAAQRKYRADNPERSRNWEETKRDRHPDAVKERAAAYRAANRERAKVRAREWRTKNPEKYQAQLQRKKDMRIAARNMRVEREGESC